MLAQQQFCLVSRSVWRGGGGEQGVVGLEAGLDSTKLLHKNKLYDVEENLQQKVQKQLFFSFTIRPVHRFLEDPADETGLTQNLVGASQAPPLAQLRPLCHQGVANKDPQLCQ
ncbi:unnamed protein product [Pleuronectes platessa]|uniref:Uncharacterized protein n=1 Tax=Pleuronectes platessa TaxID=8262 RepID=A0A9N7YN02_PLEPL|nr:unnamed protein product [Pleuronectes platessa]